MRVSNEKQLEIDVENVFRLSYYKLDHNPILKGVICLRNANWPILRKLFHCNIVLRKIANPIN